MSSISCDVDFDKVTIKMFGVPDVVIEKPPTVTIGDWQAFWPRNPYPAMRGGVQFTQKDADDNNKRRLANQNV